MTKSDFQDLFESTPDLYLVLSPKLKIVTANDAYLKATMTKREDIVGKDVFDVFPDNPGDSGADGVGNLGASFQRVFKNKMPDAMPLQKYDIRIAGSEEFEERYWSPLNLPVLDKNKKIKYILHRVEDVTENVQLKKKQAEQSEVAAELQKTQGMYLKYLKGVEERFRMLVEWVKEYAIFMVDTAGHVQSWNQGAQKIKGYTAGEIIGKHISVFYTEESIKSGEPEEILKIAKEKGRYENEGWRVRKDGTKFWADIVVTALYNDDGILRGFSKITRDLTEKKLAEENINRLHTELEHNLAQLTEVNKELEAFSYSVSHDLRAPLRAINGYAQMLEEDYGNSLNEDGARKLNVIRANAKNMGILIDDLLALSRLGRKQVQKSDINMLGLVESALMEINKTNPHKAIVKIDELKPVIGDYALIYQVIINLLSNAIKYSSQVKTPVIEIGCEEKDEEITYFIKDNGAGFDMRYSDKLFKVFQRLHPADEFEGTGVGLAIVQSVINKHGGKVWAEAEINKGAAFYFSLPKN